MRLKPDAIAPSQNFLKPQTVAFILGCLKDKRTNDLPPIPIVREDQKGNYVAIDGHNLLAVREFLGEDQEVYLAKSAEDGLPEISEQNKTRNSELKERFNRCLVERERIQKNGVNSFRDLVNQNKDLFKNWGEL